MKNWQLLEFESIASGFSFSMCFRHGAMPTVQPLALNPTQVVLHVKGTSHSLYQQNSVRDQLYYPESGFFDLPHTSADAQCSRYILSLSLTLRSCVPLAASCSCCSSMLNVRIFRERGGVRMSIRSREPMEMV